MYSVSALPPFLHRALQKYGPKLAILTPKERFIFLITRDFLDKTQKSLLAKMAAINQVSAKTDKPARRIPLISCVAGWKSKRYSSNPHLSAVDPLLEKRGVVNETPTSAETEARKSDHAEQWAKGKSWRC